MSETLVWDDAGARYYETGVSRGTLFPIDGSAGVPWNGLVSVQLDPQGGDHEAYYFDGVKYMERLLAEDFQATIQAISTPKEFRACEGVREYAPGVMTEMNKRDKFHMTWRTEISSDSGESIGHKIHVAYNNLVQPAGRNYQTIAETTALDIRSFIITATPACGRHSYFWFDSREYDLSALEAQIAIGVLPKCWELKDFVSPAGGGDGGGSGGDPDAGCLSLLEDLESYVHGQVVDDEKSVDVYDTYVYGLINNGLDIIELPAEGAFAANDSAASEVGTGDILADDDDATYITSADGDLGFTVGLPPLVGYVEGCTFELHIRMSISGGIDPDDPDNLDADAQVHISTDAAADDTTIAGFSDGTDEGMGFALSAVDGTIVDYVVPLDISAWGDTTLADVVTALGAGAYLSVVAVSNNNPDPADTPIVVNVYEAKIVMLNDTQPDKFLRVNTPTDSAWIEQHILDAPAGDDLVASHTTTIDFKVSAVPFNADVVGYLIAPSQWLVGGGGNDPGKLEIQPDTDGPVLKWYEDTETTVLASAALTLDTWYRLIVDWGWTSVRARVSSVDGGAPILDHAESLTNPKCYVQHFAGMVGGTDKTYEVVVDNAKMQVHCHEDPPIHYRLNPVGVDNYDTPLVVYGDVWTDGSDATLATVNYTDAPTNARGYLTQVLPTSASHYSGGEILSMALHFRASATGGSFDHYPLVAELDRPTGSRIFWLPGNSNQGAVSHLNDDHPFDWLIPADGVIRDYSSTIDAITLSENGWDSLDEIREFLAVDNCWLQFWTDGFLSQPPYPDGDVTVYEAWITIEAVT